MTLQRRKSVTQFGQQRGDLKLKNWVDITAKSHGLTKMF